MKPFVLDCSAALPWILEGEATAASNALLEHLADGGEAWVPALWHLELANALLAAKRRKRIDQAGIEWFLSGLGGYNLMVDEETIPLAWTKTMGLADTFGLTVYDAAYLELALRKGLALATLDEQLRKAMKSAGGELVI